MRKAFKKIARIGAVFFGFFIPASLIYADDQNTAPSSDTETMTTAQNTTLNLSHKNMHLSLRDQFNEKPCYKTSVIMTQCMDNPFPQQARIQSKSSINNEHVPAIKHRTYISLGKLSIEREKHVFFKSTFIPVYQDKNLSLSVGRYSQRRHAFPNRQEIRGLILQWKF